MTLLITFWMNDNKYARLRENEILRNSKYFRLQTIIWSNEKIFDHKKVCFLLNFWKTLIFRFLKSLSAVSFMRNWTLMSIISFLRNWILMSTISWRDWIKIIEIFFCLIMTTIEMIDKRFKIILIKLQTHDQFNWFALQFKKMLIYFIIDFYISVKWFKSIDLLFVKRLILKTYWVDTDNNKKWKD